MLAVLDEVAILVFCNYPIVGHTCRTYEVPFTVCSRRCEDEVYKAVSV